MPIELSVPPLVEEALDADDRVQLQECQCRRRAVEVDFARLSSLTSFPGSASTSTFRPAAVSAVFGLTPGPTPPSAAPSIALCSWSSPPQNPRRRTCRSGRPAGPARTARSALSCTRALDGRPWSTRRRRACRCRSPPRMPRRCRSRSLPQQQERPHDRGGDGQPRNATRSRHPSLPRRNFPSSDNRAASIQTKAAATVSIPTPGRICEAAHTFRTTRPARF